jgi:acetyl esterase
MHGGGWVFGSLDGVDRPCRAVAQRAGCVVVSVDYRLAPETKFPGALEDVYAALEWVASPAAEPAVDTRRIAVGGNSAGGNLAAAVSLMARDRSGPPICFQLLVVPMLDRRFDTPSYEQFADGPGWRRDDSRWAWGHYLERAEDADHPYASVLRAPDLTRLPQALVVTAGCDPLRDEGEAYAVRLRDAGVDAVASRYEGMPHGFLGLAVDDALRAIDDISAELRRRFAAPA